MIFSISYDTTRPVEGKLAMMMDEFMSELAPKASREERGFEGDNARFRQINFFMSLKDEDE